MSYTNNTTTPRRSRSTVAEAVYSPALVAGSNAARSKWLEKEQSRTAQLNSAKASQHADGREQAQYEVKLAIATLRVMEREGVTRPEAIRLAEAMLNNN